MNEIIKQSSSVRNRCLVLRECQKGIFNILQLTCQNFTRKNGRELHYYFFIEHCLHTSTYFYIINEFYFSSSSSP